MLAAPVLAFAQMDLKQASGVPLPAADIPAGTVSVRVVRGSFANNLSGQPVVFTINGAERTLTTDDSGRVQVTGLATGTKVKATTRVGSEQIDSQEVTIAASGIRFVLVATDDGAGASAAAPAAVAARPGMVTIGQDSRVVVDFSNERLNVYYVVHLINPATYPADFGGPLVFELPENARSTTIMEGSSPNAKANGARVTVLGPFAPGRTDVNIAYELPFAGHSARVEQAWPTEAAEFTVFALKTGDMDLESTQLLNKQHTAQQGQAIVMGVTPALKRGEALAITVTGLPSHPVWPRNTAVGAASVITLVGLWAAFGPASRRRAA